MPYPYFLDTIKQDEYGEVVNHLDTYQGIADALENHGSTVVGWTDQMGSHLDVLFTVNPIQVGNLQRGMRWNNLFVAVSMYGMFAFDINEDKLSSDYVGEKLGVGKGVTTDQLTKLIMGVRKKLI